LRQIQLHHSRLTKKANWYDDILIVPCYEGHRLAMILVGTAVGLAAAPRVRAFGAIAFA
jgi:hypothetical protein